MPPLFVPRVEQIITDPELSVNSVEQSLLVITTKLPREKVHPHNRAFESYAFFSFQDYLVMPFLAVVLENLGSNDRHDIVGEKWVKSQRIGFGPVMKSVNKRNGVSVGHICEYNSEILYQ